MIVIMIMIMIMAMTMTMTNYGNDNDYHNIVRLVIYCTVLYCIVT